MVPRVSFAPWVNHMKYSVPHLIFLFYGTYDFMAVEVEAGAYMNQINMFFSSQSSAWHRISLVGGRLVSIVPLSVQQPWWCYRATAYKSCTGIWRDFIQQPRWPSQSTSRTHWLIYICQNQATLFSAGRQVPYRYAQWFQRATTV